MNTTIISNGMITNQHPGLSANPHECHDFLYAIEYTEINIAEHLGWYTDEYIPAGLAIDPETGVISGKIYPLHKQPQCQELVADDEPLNPDGSNRHSMGLFNDTSFTFTFNVYRKYYIEDELFPGDPLHYIEEIAETSISILVIRSGNIFNTVFMEKFLEIEGREVNKLIIDLTNTLGVEVVFEESHITYNGNKYYKDDLETLYQEHPGPFAECPVVEE